MTDALIAPEPALPAVRDTDAVAFFDAWLAGSRRLNGLALRSLLYALELSPLLARRARLRRLEPHVRSEWLERLERARSTHLRLALRVLKGAAQLSYYGSDAVMLRLGYDADANVRRGRELRAREHRP